MLDTVRLADRDAIHAVSDHVGDGGESNAFLQERRHRDLVGGVEYGRHGASGPDRVVSPLQARKALEIGGLEIKPFDREQIQRFGARIESVRPGHGVSDRNAHVRVAHLSQHSSIHVVDHRMNHALRMDDHLDPLRRRVEQQTGFDQFQTLVHHRGGIHRNLASHDPVRMGHGLVRRHVVEFVETLAQERPARGREQNPADLGGAAAGMVVRRHALEDGIVLAVDGQQIGVVVPHRAHEQGAGHHQRLLVGQQHGLAGTGRRQRRQQAGRTDDGGHHGIDLGQHADVFQGLHPAQYLGLDPRIGQPLPQFGRRPLIDHYRIAGTEALALLEKPVNVVVGGEGHHAVAVGMTTRDIQSAHTDGAGRAQYANSLHGLSPSWPSCSWTAGSSISGGTSMGPL